jgi:hypothetical protein
VVCAPARALPFYFVYRYSNPASRRACPLCRWSPRAARPNQKATIAAAKKGAVSSAAAAKKAAAQGKADNIDGQVHGEHGPGVG